MGLFKWLFGRKNKTTEIRNISRNDNKRDLRFGENSSKMYDTPSSEPDNIITDPKYFYMPGNIYNTMMQQNLESSSNDYSYPSHHDTSSFDNSSYHSSLDTSSSFDSSSNFFDSSSS